jgi:AhpD family alkylhydroperoxidase
MGTATATNKAQVYLEIEQAFGQVPHWVKQLPDGMLGGFWAMFRDFYFAETKIPNKYKELIGIAVSGATRCKYCVLFHTEGARLAGATDDEIAEASAMSAVTMMGSTFLNAQGTDYDLFRSETLDIVKYVRQQQTKAPSSKAAHA